MEKRITSLGFLKACVAALAILASGNAMAYDKLTALSGTGGTGNEGYAKLVDADMFTKMGHSFDPGNPERQDAYIIVKAENAIVAKNYFLVTGGDTGSNPGRNWKDWDVYGANFDSDAEAVRDAEGWVLISEHRAEVLPAKNSAPADFTFNKNTDNTAYKYYRIEVLDSQGGGDQWLQMGEFGLGTFAEFKAFVDADTPLTDPISYRVIDGTRNNNDGESLSKLFDGKAGTKWGNGIGAEGMYAIFRVSRGLIPTYYKLVVGHDAQSWQHRNWRNYKIYGMNSTDEAAVTREAEDWVLLDERIDLTEEILPDKNMYEVYFEFNQPNTTKYQFFKIEIIDIMSGTGYCQMAEFALGDDAQLAIDKANYAQMAEDAVNLDVPFTQELKTGYKTYVDNIKAATTAFEMDAAYKVAQEMQAKANASIAAYEAYLLVVENAQNQLADDEALTAEGKTVIGDYLNTNAGPSEQFSNGTYQYIMEQLALTGEQISKEGVYLNALIELYSTADLTADAIKMYEETMLFLVSGTDGFNSAEGPDAMLDGDSSTKWCLPGTSFFVIMQASQEIAPKFYKLTTANDTGNRPGRNWKNWKVYGGNFESPEAATREADGWVLIDEKKNIGTDQLPAANFADAYFQMSKPSTTKFEYFRIEVEDIMSGDRSQMADIAFGNDGDRIIIRNQFYEDFSAILEEIEGGDNLVQKSLITDYKRALQELRTCASVLDLGTYVGNLQRLDNEINENIDAYNAYIDVLSNLDSGMFPDSESMTTWAEGYINDNEGPSNVFINGTSVHILESLELSTAQVKMETEYLQGIINAVETLGEGKEGLVCLGGFTYTPWGDHENWAKLVDNNLETKWGGVLGPEPNWVIFRTLAPSNPYFYTLNTGGDTSKFPGRNWGTWHIYGANFEGDGEVDVNSDKWVLIDEKVDIGQDRLHPTDNIASYFGLSSETTEEYIYYKVVVSKAYDGNAMQMQELYFGTEAQFEEIKDSYIQAANEFEAADKVADATLIEKYEENVSSINDVVNMEVLFRINYSLEQLRDSINASEKVYESYIAAVEKNKAFIASNTIEESDAYDIFKQYIEDHKDPDAEMFVNGSAQYIIENHLLADSTVLAEMDYMDSLKADATAAGYMKGADISALIQDPQFKQGGEGWSETVFGHLINEERTMSAAEMCLEKETYDLNQTLTGLKNGFYQLKLNAALRPNRRDPYSYNHSAVAYANDNLTLVPVVMEDMIAKDDAIDRVNSYLDITSGLRDTAILVMDAEVIVDTLGFVPWGIRGCTYAFNAGRYEISVVAQVTDGTLKFGIKNDGSSKGGDDWTGLSNFRLYYLGETEADAADGIAEAKAYNDARINTLTTVYEAYDTEDPDYFAAPQIPTAKLEALNAVTEQTGYAALTAATTAFSTLNEDKKAYVTLNNAVNNVYDGWLEHVPVDQQTEFENNIFDVKDNLASGSYDNAEACLAAKAAIYEMYPNYLQISGQNNLTATENAPFEYEITTSGVRPFIVLDGFYEDYDSTYNVLTFQYKSAAAMPDGVFYFGTPDYDTDQTVGAVLDEEAEWKTMYFTIDTPVREWGFGNKDHKIRWDFSPADVELMLSVRNVRIITTQQMVDEGGVLNAIDSVKGVDTNTGNLKGIYTLTGLRTNKLVKGQIYIIDGKKVLIK